MTKLEKRIEKFVKQFKIKHLPTGQLVFYKAVMPNFGSWYLAKMRYYGHDIKDDAGAYKPKNEVCSRKCCRDDSKLCGQGLHVGTFYCAKSFSKYLDVQKPTTIIKVLVNPEDIKCVPDEAFFSNEVEHNKVRCNRLFVHSVVKCIK